MWVSGCFAALRSVICVELLGLAQLTSAFGILLLFMGFAALLGTPIAGKQYIGWPRPARQQRLEEGMLQFVRRELDMWDTVSSFMSSFGFSFGLRPGLRLSNEVSRLFGMDQKSS
jgi:hypothetical protein